MMSVIFVLSVIYAECHLWWVSFMLSVIILNVIMLSVIFVQSVIYAECHLCLVSFMLSVIMLNVIHSECHSCWVSLWWVSLCWVSFMLSVITLNVIMLSVIILNVIMLSVIMLNVVMLNVVAPFLIPLLSPGWHQTLVQRIMYLEFNHCVTRAQRCLPSK